VKKPVLKTKMDKRLLGTWRSDRRRTLRELQLPRYVQRKTQKPLRALFGKLRLTYTRSHVHYGMDDWQAVRPYKVLATDSRSVAIRYHDELTGEWLIQHIHFSSLDADSYWVTFGFGREWFTRVRKSSARRVPRKRQ
jgi:hypothetical protein